MKNLRDEIKIGRVQAKDTLVFRIIGEKWKKGKLPHNMRNIDVTCYIDIISFAWEKLSDPLKTVFT